MNNIDHKKGLTVENLTITYKTQNNELDTVRNISLIIKPGEIYGLVGESGSGKTTFAHGIVRYLPSNGYIKTGSIQLDGLELSKLTKQETRSIWGKKITMVHQNPNTSVNPSLPVGEQIAEIAWTHLSMDRKQARVKAIEMLTKVRMPDPERVAKRYPHQLSGGQLQRILIAIALTTNPSLLIMDEPTTALDVTTEAVILDMVRDLLPEYKTAVLYITHNLGVVANLCNRVGVMYAGELMEEGPVEYLFREPRHPYTIGLLGAVPRLHSGKHDISLQTIPGFIPRPNALPSGCIYAPRCPGKQEQCVETHPPLVGINETVGISNPHRSACLRYKEILENPSQFIAPLSEKQQEERKTGSIVLEVNNMKKYFPVPGNNIRDFIKRKKNTIHAVDNISLRIEQGCTMGIVGESGCGKTTLARCIAGLEKADSGAILLNQESIKYSVTKRSADTLKNIQMVFQNPDESLNPQHPVGYSVGRSLSLLKNYSEKEKSNRIKELFKAVNLPEHYVTRLPHELSGGEKQRVAMARAFAVNPSIMICDEPISSLDMSVQASLMNLLAKLQSAMQTAYLFISHDLAAVRHLSDWIGVIYLGRLWEIGSAKDVFTPPQHPYTEALFSAIPILEQDNKQKPIRLCGNVPSAVTLPSGCRFHTRCPRKIGDICETHEPSWQDADDNHYICCHIPIEELHTLQSGETSTVERDPL